MTSTTRSKDISMASSGSVPTDGSYRVRAHYGSNDAGTSSVK